MSDTAIIIRFWHKNHEDQMWRYHYFLSNVLPRLQAQTDKDFDICMLAPPALHDSLSKRSIKPFTLDEPYDYSIHANFCKSQTRGLKDYRIQIRMDSDDLVSPEFVSIIKNSPAKYVSFQPKLFLLDELRIQEMRHRYSERKPSMFLGVKDYEECIYHRVFFRFTPCEIHHGHTWMTIHNRNYGTGKHS